MKPGKNDKAVDILYKNFLAGMSWAVGVSVGFTLLLLLVGFLMNRLGGLPIVGKFLASLVEVTQVALKNRGF